MTFQTDLTYGDVLDRISILHIKEERGLEVSFEPYRVFTKTTDYRTTPQFSQLYQINSHLWDLENSIREAHLRGDTNLIVSLSRDIIDFNRQRAEIKKQIDGNAAEAKEYHAVS